MRKDLEERFALRLRRITDWTPDKVFSSTRIPLRPFILAARRRRRRKKATAEAQTA